jgi:hypothetical protein
MFFPFLVKGDYYLKGTKLKKYLIAFTLSALLDVVLFKFDIFPLGNVLYIEDLYTKSDFRSIFSLFDNLYFKFFFVSAICFSVFTYLLSEEMLLCKPRNARSTFLSLLLIMNFGILLLSSDIYDRYLTPSLFLFLLLFLLGQKERVKLRLINFVFLGLFMFVSLALQIEFVFRNKLIYLQWEKVSIETGRMSSVYVNDTYRNYALAIKSNDYSGLIDRNAYGYKCFVQSYTTDSGWGFVNTLESYQEKIEKNFVENPRPYESSKKQGISRAKNNTDKFMYNQEYHSLLYRLVGKKAFVASWCVDII